MYSVVKTKEKNRKKGKKSDHRQYANEKHRQSVIIYTKITLFTKLFIQFIYYIYDVQDTVEGMKKTLDWMIDKNLKSSNDYNRNNHLLNKTLNIPLLDYINGHLKIICSSQSNYYNGENKRIIVSDQSLIPSEMVLGIDSSYTDITNVNHAVYASYDNNLKVLYIYDINCRNVQNENEKTRFDIYFKHLCNKFVVNVEYVEYSSKSKICKHNVILNDFAKLMNEKTGFGICGFMSIFQYFFLSYETQDDKKKINETLNILAQTQFNQEGIKPKNIKDIQQLLSGIPDKTNFLRVVNLLKENNKYLKDITQEMLTLKTPILVLNCSNANEKIKGIKNQAYYVSDFQQYECTETFTPCDPIDPINLIDYIVAKLEVHTLDLLQYNIQNVTIDDNLFTCYYILKNSVFFVKTITDKNFNIEITLKIGINEHISLSRINYIDKLPNQDDNVVKTQNEMKLNAYLTHYIASFLMGKIINDKNEEEDNKTFLSKRNSISDEEVLGYLKEYFKNYIPKPKQSRFSTYLEYIKNVFRP